MAKKLTVGKWYKFNLEGMTHIGQYVGTEQDFECCVCGKGHKAHTFNIWYDKAGGYETWGFGAKHLPEMIQELETADDEVILDK